MILLFQLPILREIIGHLLLDNGTLITLRELCRHMLQYDHVIAKHLHLNTTVYNQSKGCNKFIKRWRNHVYKLDLSQNKITDVSKLGRIHTLDLSFSRAIKGIDALGNVYELNLTGINTNFVNIPTLKNIHTLDLSWNYSLENVSPLKDCNIHTLNLSNTIVSNVSMLGYVYDLDLNTTPVFDVRALGKVHTLNLCNTQVTDVSMLGKVHTLCLANTQITDVSMLGKVHTLDLCNTKVTDVSMLGKVHTLNIACTNVADVSMLGNVKVLVLCDTCMFHLSHLECTGNNKKLNTSMLPSNIITFCACYTRCY
jgi:hypothetical protein